MLVHDVDHQLVNSAPILDQLATLNTNYKDVLYRLELEQIKLEQVYSTNLWLIVIFYRHLEFVIPVYLEDSQPTGY